MVIFDVCGFRLLIIEIKEKNCKIIWDKMKRE